MLTLRRWRGYSGGTERGERLTQLGYKVVAATSSLEALEIFRKEPGKFDLMITDCTMPDMTGVGLAKKLLGIRGGIPITLNTGRNVNISSGRAKKTVPGSSF